MLRLVLAAGLLVVGIQAYPECHLTEMNICATSLAVFAKSPSVSEDLEGDLADQCDAVDDAFTCVSNFTTDCWKPMQAELLEYGLKAVKKIKAGLCTPGTQLRAEYLEHMPCIRQAIRNRDNECMRDAKAGIEAIVNAKWNQRGRLGCCVYQRARTCSMNLVEETCGLETTQFLQKVGRLLGSRLPEYKCADHTPDSGLCDDMPPSGSPMRGAKSQYKMINHFLNFIRLNSRD